LSKTNSSAHSFERKSRGQRVVIRLAPVTQKTAQ
jgi:hypothetical protein